MRLSDGREVFCKFHSGISVRARQQTIVLIHGGPGESCISFAMSIPQLISVANIVEVDQRGCGRSQTETFLNKITLEQIILDFEEIRDKLGIGKWILWGHSFGGRIAVAYAAKFPAHISAVILENPAVDIRDGLHCILRKYYHYFVNCEKKDWAERMKQGQLSHDIVECLDLVNCVGNRDKQRFWKNDLLDAKSAELLDLNLLDDVQRRNCGVFFEKMKHDEQLHNSGWELLAQIACPVLLLYGEFDQIMDEALLEKFRENAPLGDMRRISGCGHYIHLGNIRDMKKETEFFLSMHQVAEQENK